LPFRTVLQIDLSQDDYKDTVTLMRAEEQEMLTVKEALSHAKAPGDTSAKLVSDIDGVANLKKDMKNTVTASVNARDKAIHDIKNHYFCTSVTVAFPVENIMATNSNIRIVSMARVAMHCQSYTTYTAGTSSIAFIMLPDVDSMEKLLEIIEDGSFVNYKGEPIVGAHSSATQQIVLESYLTVGGVDPDVIENVRFRTAYVSACSLSVLTLLAWFQLSHAPVPKG